MFRSLTSKNVIDVTVRISVSWRCMEQARQYHILSVHALIVFWLTLRLTTFDRMPITTIAFGHKYARAAIKTGSC